MADAEKSTPAAPLPLPSIGSYQLLEPLGSGGMSSVYKAIHTETGHHVAVKVLPRSLAKNPTLLQRFLREAKSAESLEHPNIVAIYDRGSEGGRYYLVLEYVEGSDLHDHVRSKGPMPVREAVEVVKAVARGLSHAAGRGLIHRDIKPANLLLDVHGHVKITDLGLALQVAEEDERVTRDGTTVGTVDYMSPDQARDSRGTSARSDMYSLGCTFYFLLAASPPFPGGDLPDKLRRHAQEPPPDVRASRPDVPEALAKLIQKMMAKKPEGRFADYEQLIAALDAIPLDGSAASTPAIQTALIDDDDSDDAIVLTVAEPAPAKPPGSKGRDSSRSGIPATPTREEASLAELAALDDDVPVTTRRRPKSAPVAPVSGLAADDSFTVVSAVAAGSRRVEDKSVKDYILKGLMYGVAIVLVGFGVHQLVTVLRKEPEPVVEETVEEENAPETDITEAPLPLIRPTVKKKAAEVVEAPVAPVVAWVEPEDPTSQIPAEPVFPADASRLAPPTWATSKLEAPSGAVTVLHRVDPAKGSAGRMTIARAFERPETVVELADDGPFYERDIRFGTSSRTLRARPGFRPIVVLEPSLTAHIKEQPALFVVDGHDLTFEGIDLVVEAEPGDMPVHQNAIFAVRSGTLTLRDCTVTVVGTQAASLALASIAESGVGAGMNLPRVRIDRTLVRGPALSLVHFGEGRGEFVATRSVVLSGDASVVTITAKGKGPRRVDIARSVIASRRALVEDSSLANSAPTVFKMLGDTFARIDGSPLATLLHVQSQESGSADPSKFVDWKGDYNSFIGWSKFLTTGANRSVKLTTLDDLRSEFAQSEVHSRDTATAWPAAVAREWTTPAFLETLAPESLATLRGVATGNPFLLERSVGGFPKLLVPETVPLPPPPATPPPNVVKAAPVRKVQLYAETKVSKKAAKPVKPAAEVKTPEGPLDLAFDLQDPAYAGDLGRFLNERLVDVEARHVRVLVQGQGAHACTPFEVPAGQLLEIFVTSANGPNPPTWTVPPLGNTEALISAKGADLTILGARFERDGGANVKAILRVEDGLLTLANCRLIAPGVAADGGGGLIHVGSNGSKPLAPREPNAPPVPVTRLTDCVLITGGTAIDAELGLGVVALNNCAIASGRDAFTLQPARVARHRFAADLWLNRCTVLAERSIIRLGAWKGTAPGPDRPWLVSTRESAFLDPFDRGLTPRQTAVLRDDPDGLSRGTLVWQSVNDAYEVGHFVVMDDAPLLGVNKPDIQREWVSFWGRSHIGRVYGPLRSGPTISYVKLLHDGLTPGSVVPSDFAIDGKNAQARKTGGIGADVRRLGIVAAAPNLNARPLPRKPR